MQFSFNFIPETESQDAAPVRNKEKGLNCESEKIDVEHEQQEHKNLRVIPPGDYQDTCRYKCSSALKFDCSLGKDFTLYKVKEENPEREYDLIPGKYEGGSKVWECSLDLVQYLLQTWNSKNCLKDCVLELGCGHGLPGIAALSLGYSLVVFLDFNDYVITSSTWPGIAKNCPQKMHQAICLAGDWKYFSRDVSTGEINVPEYFDLVISAETLYTVESCRMVTTLLDRHLSQSGTALIASKRYYFGVGGGTAELQTLIAHCKTLSATVVFTADDGKSNVRDIVKIERITPS